MSGNTNGLPITSEDILLDLQLQLQLQVLEIIDEILSGMDPAEAQARNSLLRQVAQHPGQPQRALLLHMMTFPREDYDQ